MANNNFIITIITGSLLLLMALLYLYLYKKILKNKEELNILVAQNEDLTKEIHHRVKNNLQIISSLLNIQVRKVADPFSKQIFDDSISRIQTLSVMHQNLYRATSTNKVEPKEYIEKVIAQLFQKFQLVEKCITIDSKIAAINLDVEKLMSVGIIIHEMVSAIIKNNMQDFSPAILTIYLRQIPGNKVELLIEIDSKLSAFSLNSINQNSLEMRLIRAFGQKLQANVEDMNRNYFKLIFDPTL